MPSTPIRLTVVLTHPVQYLAPWFRHISAQCPEIDLTVIYAVEPLASSQAVGFGGAFLWDAPLRDGYRSRVLRAGRPGDHLGSDRLGGVDAPGVGRAIGEARPDVVLVPGWHSMAYWRALVACHRRRIPVIYRGDSTLLTAHAGVRRTAWAWRTRRILRLFAAYLSVGTRSREFLTALGAPEYLIADSPHAVDNEFFSSTTASLHAGEGRRRARERFSLEHSDFVVLFAGKLEEKKRPVDAVRAAARASATLLVAGSGALESSIREEASRTGARVRFAGFLNQSEMPLAYAAADVLVLPSDRRETWGLVVNEAMASGLPAIVSDECGCTPDMVVPGQTGERFGLGDIDALAGCIDRVRQLCQAGRDVGSACRLVAEAHSFERATKGLLTACRLVARRRVPGPAASRRVLAPCGDMVLPGGLARMTFEILRALSESGAQVHCVVNSWENEAIVELAERNGVTWSRGLYFYAVRRQLADPLQVVQTTWDIVRTSTGLLRASLALRPSHVFVPEYVTALRNAPALAVLRCVGVPIIMRLGNAPDTQPFFRRLWRWVIAPLVDRFVCNSRFTERELLGLGVPSSKVSYIYNTAPRRESAPPLASPIVDRRRVVYVGQVIPEKGVDVLLDAAGLLVARGFDLRIDIVGDVKGWEAPSHAQHRDRIRDRAERLDLAGRVRFLGWREDVPEVLASGGVHCCPSQPSIREAFGIVNLEAKLAGLPSVVTPVGGLPEIVQHRIDGWICRDASAEAIAEGLAYFLEDPARAKVAGEVARQSVARFSYSIFARAWVETFDKVRSTAIETAGHTTSPAVGRRSR